jgi:endonuclease/exonuclease/phosphatase family metal-dependent hydrolase
MEDGCARRESSLGWLIARNESETMNISMKPLAPVVVAWLLASCSAVTPSGPTLKVATWNLEHLAAADGAGCRPRTEADYAKLRAYAAELKADVIGLQEVENEVAARRIFPADAYDIVMSGQPYPAQQGQCGDDGARTFVPQRTGIVIRKGVPYTAHAPLSALNVAADRARPLRWGVDVSVGGETPFRILNVHLKAGCNAGYRPDDEDCPVLMRQVPVVEA